VFVTVGMGPWPFDRLLDALGPVIERHDVFVQTGTSTVAVPAPHAPFLTWAETQRRLREADVVITHAGNTVRLVQRLGKVPIAIARESARGEMRNDHQVEYLAAERSSGRVVVLDGDLRDLPACVDRHLDREPAMLAAAAELDRPDPQALAAFLDRQLITDAAVNPFATHPTRRYRWAFDQLRGRAGRHLDIGVGDGEFCRILNRDTDLRVIAVDAHHGYLQALRSAPDAPPALRMRDRIPLAAGSIQSVSMLDSLEHVPDEAAMLAEVHRVLAPGGVLVLTVPARHLFSILDPDNAKVRAPALHGAVYRARFGAARYTERFIDPADGLRGDLDRARDEHTNYMPSALLELLSGAGFRPQVRDGANLFWRFFQVPQLLLPPRLARGFDGPLRWDGALFHRANLFLTAVRA
jgi:SAM-dependent methyltransferase